MARPRAGPSRGLRAHAPDGTQVVIVAGPDPAHDTVLVADDLLAPVAGAAPEVVLTARPFRPASARNAGMRRAGGAVVLWIATGATVTGDVISPVIAALADETVAVAGAVGLRADSDVRRPTPGAAGDADAIDRTLLAFRREELVTLGFLDEHQYTDDQLDRWWSLVLRDGPDLEDEAEDDEEAADEEAEEADEADEEAEAADEAEEDETEDEPSWNAPARGRARSAHRRLDRRGPVDRARRPPGVGTAQEARPVPAHRPLHRPPGVAVTQDAHVLNRASGQSAGGAAANLGHGLDGAGTRTEAEPYWTMPYGTRWRDGCPNVLTPWIGRSRRRSPSC